MMGTMKGPYIQAAMSGTAACPIHLDGTKLEYQDHICVWMSMVNYKGNMVLAGVPEALMYIVGVHRDRTSNNQALMVYPKDYNPDNPLKQHELFYTCYFSNM